MADQGSEGLLSPFLRNRRVQSVRPYLAGRILDVGCGSGALARYVAATDYVGLDIDLPSLNRAKVNFPHHRFVHAPTIEGKFDTVVALAVIEHVSDPVAFLKALRGNLAEGPARIVCTTPHPSVDLIHGVGSRLGLFSRSANEEHETLLDYPMLQRVGAAAGLKLSTYKRFLLGGNQIAVYTSEGCAE